jgi:hypothetical protein
MTTQVRSWLDLAVANAPVNLMISCTDVISLFVSSWIRCATSRSMERIQRCSHNHAYKLLNALVYEHPPPGFLASVAQITTSSQHNRRYQRTRARGESYGPGQQSEDGPEASATRSISCPGRAGCSLRPACAISFGRSFFARKTRRSRSAGCGWEYVGDAAHVAQVMKIVVKNVF